MALPPAQPTALLSMTPPSVATGSTDPLSTAPLSTAPRSMAPLSMAPGSMAPLSTAPLSTAPGSTAPLSTAPGSTAPLMTVSRHRQGFRCQSLSRVGGLCPVSSGRLLLSAWCVAFQFGAVLAAELPRLPSGRAASSAVSPPFSTSLLLLMKK